jgi:thiosulfate reductase cytochrome b subunit
MKTRSLPIVLSIIGVSALFLAGILLANNVTAQEQTISGSPMHPDIPLLDADGQSVLTSGKPISTMQSCGTCHDTAFITQHSFHSDVGLSSMAALGTVPGGRAWEMSPGYFGNWNPLTYRYLSPDGDTHPDLTTVEWLQVYGARHVGGGPAVTSRGGQPLTSLAADASNVETSVVNPATGQLEAWNWGDSGVEEMNCFLCHTASPNTDARRLSLEAGEFGWANTATLLGTGIVEQTVDGWTYNTAAFTPDGEIAASTLAIQDPTSANCGSCHGVVHADNRTPLTVGELTAQDWNTYTTGQIMSPQKIANSGLNLDDKEAVSRSWDVHLERAIDCTNCHYSLNNPVYYREDETSQPDYLLFDPRRLDLGDYLYRPLHEFANGDSQRRCDSCHSIDATHDWLPYKERHTTALACESCHIPELYAPALEYVDWTVLRADSQPVTQYRGLEGGQGSLETTLVTGYTPVLLPRSNEDGPAALAPYNLISAWYWVYGDPARPVPLRDLQAAYFAESGIYQADILAALDSNTNGQLSDDELRLDTPEKTALIASHLQALGLDNPRIVGEVQPYSINHNVAAGEWAIRDCDTCHSENSRIAASLPLSDRLPGGVLPTGLNSDVLNGEINQDGAALLYQPQHENANLYVLGHDAVDLIDTLGMVVFMLTLLAISTHGGLRYLAARRGIPHELELRRVYMYSVYERQWHWLQTVVILGLLFTGLVIHKPDKFSLFQFDFVVPVHNILALILVINAALSLFYHLVSGEIRQYLPTPYGFFNDAIVQAKYYLRGIFKGEAHPFEKTPQRKMNPLQQLTYLGILNVLLPAQVITGILMWGQQHFPALAASLGGLPFLAPLHTLLAWLFATFIVAHVYLTTTGPTPLTGIKAMMMGWDDVEVHTPASPEKGSTL